MKKLPTKLYLHLSNTSEYADFTVFTTDMRDENGNNRMPQYPFVCEFTPQFGFGVTEETINHAMTEIRLKAMYQEAGELQAKLDAKKEEIQKLLCIGYDTVRVEAEWLPPEAPHTANVTAGPDGRIVNKAPEFDAFDDDIPF